MREVSVRILHFAFDLARTAGVAEEVLTRDLPSVVAVDGVPPDWVDWDDIVAVVERLEAMLGGPEGLARATRDALPTAYPEFRGFAAVFVRPIPLFTFAMTRLIPTMYRHIWIDEIERLGDDRVRWTQKIPEQFRGSEAFHRSTRSFVEVFPRHLDLPEARIEQAIITPHVAEFVAAFPPSEPISVRGSRAVSSTASVLALQLNEAFAKIARSLRTEPGRDANGDASPWAERLALSPRQREVFTLLVEGRANKDIASTLGCSERNIEFHVGRILRAARVSSRTELLVKVLGTRP